MAVITNNISGSSSGGSRIAITGSVIISNAESFPQTGADTVFFVSGSESEKTVFGGAAKISGSLSTDGSVSLGDSADDAVTVAGDLTVNGGDLNTTSSTFNLLQSASILNIGTTPATRAVNLGTADAIQAVTIGSIFGASSLVLEAGTGNMLLTGSTSTTYTIGGETGTGTLTLGRSTESNTIDIGNGSVTAISRVQTVNIGTNASSLGSALISIGSIGGSSSTTIAANSQLTLTGSTGTAYIIGGQGQAGTITLGRSTSANTINIGSAGNNTSNTQTINIGGGAGTSAVSLGATTGTSALNLQAGTGNVFITGATTTNYTIGSAAGTGTITVGQSTATNIISIGSAGNSTANTQTVFIANGSGASTVTIGSNAAHTGKTTIQAGTNSGGGVVVAQSSGRLGFFGLSTPVTIQGATGDTSVSSAGSTNNVFRNTTFTGGAGATAYTIGDIVKALKVYGLIST